MPIRLNQLESAVAVEIDHREPKAERFVRESREPDRRGNVAVQAAEGGAAFEGHGSPAQEVGDHQHGPARAHQVAKGDPHTREG